MVRIGFVGDVRLTRDVADAIHGSGSGIPLDHVKETLQACDLLVANLESPLAYPSGIGDTSSDQTLSMQAAHMLRISGVDAVHLANNHIMDQGQNGLNSTLAALKGAGIASYGAAFDIRAAEEAHYEARAGVRIALLGVGDTSRYYAGNRRAGIAPLRERRLMRRVKDAVRKSDVVVVTFHGDMEFCHYPSPWRVRLSRRLVDWGAKIVVQHHAHVCQGIEVYRGALIAYGLGNFVFRVHGNAYQEHRAGTDTGLYLEVDVAAGAGIVGWRVKPVMIGVDHKPHFVASDVEKKLVAFIDQISAIVGNPRALRSERRRACAQEMRRRALELYYCLAKCKPRLFLSRCRHYLVATEELRVAVGFVTRGYF